jgi:biopolymer transport protein TolR
MGFSAGGKKGAVRSDINITPLVDVVLVLLIIFMVATPILLKQMEVKVPQSADNVDLSPPPVTTEQVVLQVDKENRISINHEPVAPEVLADRVRTIFEGRREKLMFFDVDDNANYGEVVHIMDVCRGAGVKVLGIMTKS